MFAAKINSQILYSHLGQERSPTLPLTLPLYRILKLSQPSTQLTIYIVLGGHKRQYINSSKLIVAKAAGIFIKFYNFCEIRRNIKKFKL